jgi:hypothetical protein
MCLDERLKRLEQAQETACDGVCLCLPRRYDLRDNSGEGEVTDTRPAQRCDRCNRAVVILRLVNSETVTP